MLTSTFINTSEKLELESITRKNVINGNDNFNKSDTIWKKIKNVIFICILELADR